MSAPKRPARVKFDPETSIAATVYIDRKVKIKEDQTRLMRVGILSILTEKLEDGKFNFPIDPNWIAPDKFKKQEIYQGEFGKCVHFAESLYSLLKQFLALYFRDKNSGDIDEKYSKIESLDFMSARDLLSHVLKTDEKFKKIADVDSSEKLKTFTRTLNDFILDRNVYAHGLLYLLYPEFIPVLEVKTSKKETIFVEIDDEVISDYHKTYTYLHDILYKCYDLELAELRK